MQVNISVIPSYMRVRRVIHGRDRMVVEFINIKTESNKTKYHIVGTITNFKKKNRTNISKIHTFNTHIRDSLLYSNGAGTSLVAELN
jgi:hypothetical protein